MARYSAKFREYSLEPVHQGTMADADAVGSAELHGPAQFMTIYLRLNGDVVCRATFQTYACGAAVACGSVLTELIVGRTLLDCASLTEHELSQALDGIPADKLDVARLAIGALRAALQKPG